MRSGVVASAAYAAMTRGGKRCLHLIEGEVERGGGTASISLYDFDRRFGCSRRATCFALKQLALLGFVVIGTGARRVNMFTLIDGWRAIDAVEAKRLVELARLPKPQRAAAPKSVKPAPKPVKQPKPVEVERPRFSERRMPSMPVMSWDRAGR